MHLPISARVCDEIGATLIWREASASTNSELVSQAAHADLTVLATDTQTAGRGRLDRAWSTPPGTALAVSVFLAHEPGGADSAPAPDPRRLGWVPLLAGVAMVRAVRSLGVTGAGLKWPNDVLVDGRKLCGILTELTSTGVVVGAGLNVSMTAQQLPVPTATSLIIGAKTSTRRPCTIGATILRRSAQVRVLNEMRIPFRMNPDGKVLVVREQYLTAAGAKPADQRQTEPDFEAIA